MEIVKSDLDARGTGDGTPLHSFSPEELHESTASPRECKLSGSSNPGAPNPRPTKMIKKESSPTSAVVEMDKADGDSEILVGDEPPVADKIDDDDDFFYFTGDDEWLDSKPGGLDPSMFSVSADPEGDISDSDADSWDGDFVFTSYEEAMNYPKGIEIHYNTVVHKGLDFHK